jgi:dCTP deaminase
MTLLSNSQILRHMESGNIIISPFNEKHLNNVSYDLTLGGHAAFYRSPKEIEGYPTPAQVFNKKREIEGGGGDLNLQDLKDLGYWTPFSDDPAARYKLIDFTKTGYLALGSGQRILGHSQEFAGGRNVVTTSLQATSTAGRLGITVCMCAGWGDVGYFGRWTLEISNESPYPIVLPVGARIAQLCFHEVAKPTLGTSYEKKGSYQSSADIDELEKSWKPEHMLPKKMKVAQV